MKKLVFIAAVVMSLFAFTGAAAADPVHSGWTFCVYEGSSCTFTGVKNVRYGNDNGWASTILTTSPVDCSNTRFGDPAPYTQKYCEYQEPTQPTHSGWTFCAWEMTTCTLTGTQDVRYGNDNGWTPTTALTSSVSCANTYFGDPAPGSAKYCEKKTSTAYYTEEFTNGPCSLPSRWQYEPTPCSSTLYKTVTGANGNGVGLHTTSTSYGPNSNSQMTSIWTSDAHQSYGSTTWYSVQMRLPSPGYTPTPGEWNWLVEWHDDDTTQSLGADSYAFGVWNDNGGTPHLVLRLAYGDPTHPTYNDTTCATSSITYNHWYKLQYGITWSDSPTTGHMKFVVDGTTVCDLATPTLYALPGGGHSTINSFGLYNYHYKATYDMESQFDNVKVGPTQASVS